MVQDPSGIMVRSSAKSRSAKVRKYRIMEVSERLVEKIGCVKYELLRALLIETSRAGTPIDTPKICPIRFKCSAVMVSSKEIPTTLADTSRRLIFNDLAVRWISAASFTSIKTVSKKFLVKTLWSLVSSALTNESVCA